MRVPGRRWLNLGGFLICAGLLGYALIAQFYLAYDPCPLCIFQRVGVAAMGVAFLLAALHGPRDAGARVYGALIVLAALVTVLIAARHVWIQHLPPGSVPVCGATLDYMLEIFPLADVIRKVLTGSGECAKVTWRFLGISMPAWVLMASGALGAFGGWANFARRRA